MNVFVESSTAACILMDGGCCEDRVHFSFPAYACVREGVCQNIVVEDERRSPYTRIYICICIYICIHENRAVHTYTHTYIHACIHTYIHTYIHHTHTYIHRANRDTDRTFLTPSVAIRVLAWHVRQERGRRCDSRKLIFRQKNGNPLGHGPLHPLSRLCTPLPQTKRPLPTPVSDANPSPEPFKTDAFGREHHF